MLGHSFFRMESIKPIINQHMSTWERSATPAPSSRSRAIEINHNMHPTHATMFMPSRRSRGSHKLLRIEPCTPMCASEAVGTEQAQDRCLKQPWWCAADFKQGGSAATGAHPGHQTSKHITRTSFASLASTPVAARRAARTPLMLARAPRRSHADSTLATTVWVA